MKKMKSQIAAASIALIVCSVLSACGGAASAEQQETSAAAVTETTKTTETTTTQTAETKESAKETETEKETEKETAKTETASETETSSETEAKKESKTETSGKIVVIDPGHQAKGNNDKEPNGPGSSEMKTKVSSGTDGVASGEPEYKLALTVGLKLRDELEKRGYTVSMTRETNDVDISNAERAKIANDLNADVFIRIHADGSDDREMYGCMTLCPTAENIYNSNIYKQSRHLSDCVLEEYSAATGARANRVWETDTMTGMNWSNVPVTTIEMGYMSNPEEDMKMQDASYQALIVEGLANGIDKYMEN